MHRNEDTMKLVIGGFAQGKRSYILENDDVSYAVFDKTLPSEQEVQTAEQRGQKILIDHLHLWIWEELKLGKMPEEELFAFTAENPDCTVLCDEIGNGIVPMEAFEREYRERTGRILIELAKRAEEVVRVLCGIGQRIK